jgi:GGDEF domain-containing protein
VVWLSLKRITVSGVEGKRVSDEVLRHCAQRVKGSIRASDLAALFDDNTIVIALTAMRTPGDARTVAVRLLLDLGPPVLVEGRERSVGVSSGVVTASDRSISIDELLDRARTAAAEAVEAQDPVRVDQAP